MAWLERESREVTQLIWQSATELARRIAAREVSSLEVVNAHIDRIEAVNARLNAVVIPLFDEARTAATKADEALARGDAIGPLHGVPTTIKECYHLAGTVSCIGVDRFAKDVIPEDGPLVRRLRRAGAIILGKTNVPQTMLLHETDSPIYGRTSNPWNLARSAGGSSGGEAAIIAAGGSPLGLANDLGGSIRQPAHVCGVVGLKPTTGRFTNKGCRSNLSGLRLIATNSGAIARHTVDLHLMMRVLDPRNPGEERFEDELDQPIRDPAAIDVTKLRIGVLDDDGFFRPSPAVRRAVHEAAAALRGMGVDCVEFKPPDLSGAMGLYFGLIGADGARALGQVMEGSRVDSRIERLMQIGRIEPPFRKIFAALASVFGQPHAALLLRATGRKTPEQMERMRQEMERYVRTFNATLEAAQIDALICPPYALPAPQHGATLNLPPAGSYCYIANLLGIPAGVVPCTRVHAKEESDRRVGLDLVERAARHVERGSAGLPVGVQVLARQWREDIVLAVMAALEREFQGKEDFPGRPPDERQICSKV